MAWRDWSSRGRIGKPGGGEGGVGAGEGEGECCLGPLESKKLTGQRVGVDHVSDPNAEETRSAEARRGPMEKAPHPLQDFLTFPNLPICISLFPHRRPGNQSSSLSLHWEGSQLKNIPRWRGVGWGGEYLLSDSL